MRLVSIIHLSFFDIHPVQTILNRVSLRLDTRLQSDDDSSQEQNTRFALSACRSVTLVAGFLLSKVLVDLLILWILRSARGGGL